MRGLVMTLFDHAVQQAEDAPEDVPSKYAGCEAAMTWWEKEIRRQLVAVAENASHPAELKRLLEEAGY